MPSVARQRAHVGGRLPPVKPVRAGEECRTTEGRFNVITEFWTEWLFTALVLAGGILMLIMLLRA